jgi:transposase-like protein
MKIMHTTASEAIAQRPKRGYYAPELNAQIAGKSQVAGASVAGVALTHEINANSVHRWLREQSDALLPVPLNLSTRTSMPTS